MNYQFYNELPDGAKYIREEVFMKEQGFENEFDAIDQTCIHLVLYKDNQPIACARMFEKDHKMMLGRIAVLKEFRHLHVGSQIMNLLEQKAKDLHFDTLVLSAQTRASEFYEKNGFTKIGDEYMDEHCPHIHMEKII